MRKAACNLTATCMGDTFRDNNWGRSTNINHAVNNTKDNYKSVAKYFFLKHAKNTYQNIQAKQKDKDNIEIKIGNKNTE